MNNKNNQIINLREAKYLPGTVYEYEKTVLKRFLTMPNSSEVLNDLNKKQPFGIPPHSQILDRKTNFFAIFGKENKIRSLSIKMFISMYNINYDFLDIDPKVLLNRFTKMSNYKQFVIMCVYDFDMPLAISTIEDRSISDYMINVVHVSITDFLDSGLFKEVYIDQHNSSHALRTLFNFRGFTYADLQIRFKLSNIDLSGGSTTKRHILNPMTHRFSQFITILEGSNMNGVIQSYYMPHITGKTSGINKSLVGPKEIKSHHHSIGNLDTKASWDRFSKISEEFLGVVIKPNIKNNNRKVTPLSETIIKISKSQNTTTNNNNFTNSSNNIVGLPKIKDNSGKEIKPDLLTSKYLQNLKNNYNIPELFDNINLDPWIDEGVYPKNWAQIQGNKKAKKLQEYKKSLKEIKAFKNPELEKKLAELDKMILESSENKMILESSEIGDPIQIKSLDKIKSEERDWNNEYNSDSESDYDSDSETDYDSEGRKRKPPITKDEIDTFNKHLKELEENYSKENQKKLDILQALQKNNKYLLDDKQIELLKNAETFKQKEIVNQILFKLEPILSGKKDSLKDIEVAKEFSELETYTKYLNSNNYSNNSKKKIISNNLTKRNYHSNFNNKNSRNYSTVNSKKDDDDGAYLISFLKIIKDKLNEKDIDTLKVQEEIEQEWIKTITEKMLNSSSTKNSLISNIHTAFKNLSLISKNTKRFKNWFPNQLLLDDVIRIESVIISFAFIVTYYRKMSYTNIASIIGNAIFWELYKIYIKNIKKGKNIYNLGIIKNFDIFKNVNDLNNIKAIELGDVLISLFHTLEVIDRVLDYDNDNLAFIKINTSKIQEIIDNTIIIPTSLPMVHPPLEWNDNEFGGFLSNKEDKKDLITGSIHLEGHKIEQRAMLYTTINYLNNIKFKINKDLLNYLKNDGNYLLKLEKEEHFIQNRITLSIAETYSNIPFYITTSADWRGRIYTNSFFLTYQGNNLAKSLLHFDYGESLNTEGIFYLYIYGANAFNYEGISKKTLTERYNWVKLNYDLIISMDETFIMQAEEKIVFTSFCLEMRKIHKDPKALVHLPVFLDATCSGIQHLSALVKDLEAGSRVNLIPQKDNDIPGDIYKDVLKLVNQEIEQFGYKNLDKFWFSDVKLSRKEIKVLVMTKPYNATTFGMSQMLANNLNTVEEEIKYKNEKGEEKSFKIIKYLLPSKTGKKIEVSKSDLFIISKIVNDQVFLMFPPLKSVYDYLTNVSSVLSNLNIPISWFTPSGLLITQDYREDDIKNISIRLGGKKRSLVIKNKLKIEGSNEYKKSKAKQKQAIIPNIIHSLDASHLMEIIKISNSDIKSPVITVHDCFGTHPNKMGELEYLVKKQFILIYTKDNFLSKFHKKVIESIIDNNYILVKKEDLKELQKNKKSLKSDLNNNKIKVNKKDIIKINNNYNGFILEDYNSEINILDINTSTIYTILPVPNLGKLDLEKIIDSKYMIT